MVSSYVQIRFVFKVVSQGLCFGLCLRVSVWVCISGFVFEVVFQGLR